jgi:hypothetical protein
MTTAKHLIARSVSHNEIVTAEWSHDLETDLLCESDDSVENGDVYEFWGCDDDGNEWRVHLSDVEAGRDAAISALRDDAANAGDMDQVELCQVALGNESEHPTTVKRARAKCLAALASAAAQV